MQMAETSRQRANKNAGGFTLIETVITLVVLSIAAVGVLSVFTVGMRGSASPVVVDQATELAQGELDAVIGIKDANGFSASALNTGTGQGCNTAMPTGFSCSLDICYVASGSLDNAGACNTATNYKRVAVTITNAAIGTVKAVTLLTYY